MDPRELVPMPGDLPVTGGPPGALRLDWGPERSDFQGLRYEETHRLSGKRYDRK